MINKPIICHKTLFFGDTEKCGVYLPIGKKLLKTLHRLRGQGFRLTFIRESYEGGLVTVIASTLTTGIINTISITAEGGFFDVIFRVLTNYDNENVFTFFGYDSRSKRVLPSPVATIEISKIMPLSLDYSYTLLTNDNRAGAAFMTSHSAGAGYYYDPDMLLMESVLTKSGNYALDSYPSRPQIDKSQPEYNPDMEWYRSKYNGTGNEMNLYGTGFMDGGQGVHWMVIDHDYPYNVMISGSAILVRRVLGSREPEYKVVHRFVADAVANTGPLGMPEYIGPYQLGINPVSYMYNTGGDNHPIKWESSFNGGTIIWDRKTCYPRKDCIFLCSEIRSWYTYPDYPADKLYHLLHRGYRDVWKFSKDGVVERQFGMSRNIPEQDYITDGFPEYKISSFMIDYSSTESGFARITQLRVRQDIEYEDLVELFVSSDPNSMLNILDSGPKVSFRVGTIMGYGDREENHESGYSTFEVECWRIADGWYGFIVLNEDIGGGWLNKYQDAIVYAKLSGSTWNFEIVYAPPKERSLGYGSGVCVDPSNPKRIIVTETDRPDGGDSTRENFVVYLVDVESKSRSVIREHKSYANFTDTSDRAANQIRFF